jgi:hypothetical protein
MSDDTTKKIDEAKHHEDEPKRRRLEAKDAHDGEQHVAASDPATNAGVVGQEHDDDVAAPSSPSTNAGVIEGEANPTEPRNISRDDVSLDGKDRSDLPDSDAQKQIPRVDAWKRAEDNLSVADLAAKDERLQAAKDPEHTKVEHVDADERPRDVQRFGSFQDEVAEIEERYKSETGTLDDLVTRKSADIAAAKLKHGII